MVEPDVDRYRAPLSHARRRLRWWVGGLSVVVISFTGLSIWAEINRREVVMDRTIAAGFIEAGDMLVIHGNLPAALKAYQDSLVIRERLAKSDPGNASWQHDLSVSHMCLAEVYIRAGDRAAARDELTAAHEIRARLIALSPDNASWQSDLARVDRRLAELGL